ncbi:MAG: AAA family ATPase [Planctomycetota bacterium]
MRLQLKKSYLSLKRLDVVDFPPFTILTGINGSGKTHLLEAIEKGAVEVNGIAPTRNSIKRFNWANFVPNKLDEVQAARVWSHHQNAEKSFRDRLKNIRSQIEPLFETKTTDPFSWERAVEYLNTFASDRDWGRAKSQLDRYLSDIKRSNGIQERIINQAIGSFGFLDLAADPSKVMQSSAFSVDDIFKQNIASIFTAYHDLLIRNKIYKADQDSRYLSPIGFAARYGPSPWEQVNSVLRKCSLPFSVSAPNEHDLHKFTPVITKDGDDTPLNFAQMSSGERVLISLAMCVYNSGYEAISIAKPRVILLDEVDAVLHPSMAKIAISIIRDSIVLSAGIPVIMTTHSPTTVAFAEDDDVFSIATGGCIERCGRQKAIDRLTAGIPTLAVDFEGRRQIFVEGGIDAYALQRIDKISRRLREFDHSLSFIPTGSKTVSGYQGGGCSNVIRIVNDLRQFGNKSVFGMIDWDLKNAPSRFVKVLGEGVFYSLESLVLNPLAIGLLLLQESDKIREDIGFNFVNGIDELPDSAQTVADIVVSAFTDLKDASATIEVACAGGWSVFLPRELCQQRGHDYADALKSKFPSLKRLGNHQDSLLRGVIEKVYDNCPSVLPAAFLDAFSEIDQHGAAPADLHLRGGHAR